MRFIYLFDSLHCSWFIFNVCKKDTVFSLYNISIVIFNLKKLNYCFIAIILVCTGVLVVPLNEMKTKSQVILVITSY